eukprot:1081946-Rhodomonas_salina.1
MSALVETPLSTRTPSNSVKWKSRTRLKQSFKKTRLPTKVGYQGTANLLKVDGIFGKTVSARCPRISTESNCYDQKVLQNILCYTCTNVSGYPGTLAGTR